VDRGLDILSKNFGRIYQQLTMDGVNLVGNGDSDDKRSHNARSSLATILKPSRGGERRGDEGERQIELTR